MTDTGEHHAIQTFISQILIAFIAIGCVTHRTNTQQTPMTTTERNKAVARRWTHELWGGGNLAVATEVIRRTMCGTTPAIPSRLVARSVFRNVSQATSRPAG